MKDTIKSLSVALLETVDKAESPSTCWGTSQDLFESAVHICRGIMIMCEATSHVRPQELVSADVIILGHFGMDTIENIKLEGEC